MKAKTLGVQEFVKKVRDGDISVLEHTSKIVKEIEKKNKKFCHFSVFDKSNVLEQARELEKDIKKGRKGKLLGVPVSVKDSICVKGVESRACSKILSGYKPVFDATCVKKARLEGAIILGKTVQDEFGFGTFSTNVGAGKIPLNPLDTKRSCGGSSGGAAGFSALTEFTHAAIAQSTGGSIAAPASFCAVASITPTYGLVSRYGLMDYSNSLDKIGTMGKYVSDCWHLLSAISGKDELDSTSISSNALEMQDISFLNVGVPSDLLDAIENKKLKDVATKKIEKLESLGVKISEVKMPLNTEFSLPAYYLIAMSEASTNLAKYCGMRYGLEEKLSGSFNEYFSNIRSLGFGEEAKRRILLGTFARMSGFRDAYYLKAMKARTLLLKEFKEVFSKVDLLAFPAMPSIAPRFSEISKLSPLENYSADLCTVPANLAGLPHATINAGFLNSMPVGLMICAKHLDDAKVLSAAYTLEGLK